MSHLIYKEYKLVRHMGMNLYKITRNGSGKVPDALIGELFTAPIEAHKAIDALPVPSVPKVQEVSLESPSEAPVAPKKKPAKKTKKKETKKED